MQFIKKHAILIILMSLVFGIAYLSYYNYKTQRNLLLQQMHNNPLLVEDVCRNILQHAKDTFSESGLEIFAEARSLESIHKHDVIAEGRIVTNEN